MPAKTKPSGDVTRAELRRRQRQSQRDKKQSATQVANTVVANRRKKNRPMAGPSVVRTGAALTSMATLRASLMSNETQGMLLCRQMALPAEQMPVRLPTMNMARTAVGKFLYNHKVYATGNITSASPYDTAAQQGFTADTETANLMFAVYGQLARTMVSGPYFDEAGTYQILFGKGVQNYTDPGWSGGSVGESYTVNTMLPIVALDLTAGSAFLGLKRMPIGESNGKSFFFATAGCRLKTATYFSLPGAGRITLYRHTDYNEIVTVTTADWGSASNTAGQPVLIIPENGHYAIELSYYKCEAASPAWMAAPPVMAFDLVKDTADVRWGWHMHQMMDLNPVDFTGADSTIGERARRTGCAVLISNVGNAYNKQGETVAGRVQNTKFSDITPELLSTTQEMYTGLAAKGAYTYMDFTEEDEVFEDVVKFSNRGGTSPNVTVIGMCYKLDRTSPVHVITFQGVYPRNSYFARVHLSVEWFSASQRYPMASPYLDPIHLAEARRINNSTSYFYENPIHMEDIMRFIRKGWSLVRSRAGPISRGIATAFPETAPIALPLGRLLQS